MEITHKFRGGCTAASRHWAEDRIGDKIGTVQGVASYTISIGSKGRLNTPVHITFTFSGDPTTGQKDAICRQLKQRLQRHGKRFFSLKA